MLTDLLESESERKAVQGFLNRRLLRCSKSGDTQAAEIYLEEGANPNTHERKKQRFQDDGGGATINFRSVLTCAVLKGNKDMVELLLESGANPDGVELETMTPLAWSAAQGKLAITATLITNGADVNREVDIGITQSILGIARGHEHKNVAELLEENGAVRYPERAS